MTEKPRPTLQVRVPDSVGQGHYANLAAVASSDTEFVLDFAFVQPGNAQVQVHTRVVLPPRHAKMLARILADRVADYEQRNGEITLPNLASGQFTTH